MDISPFSSIFIIAYFAYIATPKTKPDFAIKRTYFTKKERILQGLVIRKENRYTVYIKTFVHIAKKSHL